MASSTRSGRYNKDEETGDLNIHSIEVKVKDSSNLRKSARETPSSMRSDRLESQTPLSSSDKRMSNPLRRSERIEKYGSSSSSGSKKSSSKSSSLGKKKKHREERRGKLMIINTKEQCDGNQVYPKSDRSSKKRKRLDARSYRSFLRPQTKPTKISAVMVNCKEDTTSEEDTSISESSVSEEVHEVGDDCTKRKEKERQNAHEGSVEAQGSSSSLRGLFGSTFAGDRQREKCKLGNVDANESKDWNNLPISKCTDGSSQSSPPAVTDKESGADGAGREICGKGGRIDAHKLGTEELRPTELLEPTSEESFLVDVDPESGCNIDASIKRKVAANLDSEISLKPLVRETSNGETSIAHDTCSAPLLTKSKNTEGCTLCGKLQRVHDNSQTREICACHAERKDDLSISVFEDTGRPSICGLGGTAQHPSSLHSAAIQTDAGSNACVICKNPGMLLCCDGKGCKKSYHLSCLDPPLKDIPPGAWLCLFCVKKKMKFGVYSVSEGIESVLDIKDGQEDGKLYLVKYKSLAHVHNRWIPESQMLLEAPRLLAKFNRRHLKEKVIRWKKEWTEPQRLIQKRLLLPLKRANGCFSSHDSDNSLCSYEWLVKWKGLGYEHATWEFENSPTLCSFEGISLVKDYENRQEMAKKLLDPSRAEKALQVKKNPFHRLSRLPDGFLPEFDNDHLNSINRLLEFWHRSHNAIFIDDQERIIKSILFILALQEHICRPFLIISTTNGLSMWETEFARLAPSINAVVYTGSKDFRKIIRAVEFYEEGGCIMFQVLLSHPDAISEDFEALNCIGWEAMIVDECQNLRMSKHFDKLKLLSADFRLLLLGGQLKDNLAECLNMLAFVDSGGKEICVNSLKFDPKDSVGALAILKEKLARYVAYEHKPDSSNFLEYWVPVPLSNVQLEQYCSTLLSNYTVLNSCVKTDKVGALRDILISTWKCCDHPYIVDPLLQSSLTKGLLASEYLDIGINASGKLLLLDKVLREIKNQGLRVLILFQSIGGAGRNSIGDILDDFIRQRFGADSYERVDSGLVKPKKVAALSMFNDKTSGRFVFLIENRACLPSVKLSSVDAVIIFDSDWNPLNDLSALQKISIESHFEQLRIYRLYSSFTIEEKILIFSKQGTILDSNHISPSASHSLLSWGASYLFNKLDELHQHGKPSNSSETLIYKLDDLVLEFLNQLPTKAEGNHSSNCSLLIKAQQSGVSYLRSIILFGEKKGISSFDTDPPVFWSNLLVGRYPLWRYISQSSQRIRRKVQHLDDLSKLPDSENDGGKKKRRKTKSEAINPLSLQTQPQDKKKGVADAMYGNLIPHGSNQSCNISERNAPVIPTNMAKEHECFQNLANALQDVPSSAGIKTEDISDLHISHMVEYEGRQELRNEQRSLHLFLKTDLSKLCETLRLPGDVLVMAERLLEFVMNKLRVDREPESVLQALKISLCWRAASFLKHKVDRKESLALAKKYLNFECEEKQVYSAYSKLRTLKKKFSHQTDALRDENELTCLEYQSISSRDVPVEHEFDQTSTLAASRHQMFDGEKISEKPDDLYSVDELIEGREETVLKVPTGLHEHIGSLKDELLKKQIDLIEIVCSKREDELNQKQQVELSDFNIQRGVEMMKLKKAYDSDLELIRSVSLDCTVRSDKIKCLNHEFTKKMASFDQHMKFQRRKLLLMLADARNKERQIKDRWLEEAKAGRLAEIFDKLPLSDSGFTLESFVASGQVESCISLENTILSFLPRSDQPLNDAATTDLVEPNAPTAENFEVPITVVDREVGGIPIEGENLCSQSNNMNDVESVDPADTSREIQETVPTEFERDRTVENGSQVITRFGVTDTANGEIDDSRREIEALTSRCNIMNDVESVDPADTSRETQETVPPQLEHDTADENGSLAITLSGVADTANGKIKDSLKEIEASASQCNNLSGVKPSEHGIPPVKNAATENGSQGITPFRVIGTANGEIGDSLREIEAPAFQCNIMNDVESVDPTDTFREMQETVPPELERDTTVENESRAITPSGVADTANGKIEDSQREIEAPGSQCNNISAVVPFDDGIPSVENAAAENGSQAITPFGITETANGRMDDPLIEIDSPGSQCNIMSGVEPVELDVPSVENPSTISPGVKGFSIQTESLASTIDPMTVAENCSSGMAAANDITQHGSIDTLDGTLQGLTDFSSSADTSGRDSCDISFPANQVPSVSEHERLDLSVSMEYNQGVHSMQQVVVPVLKSANDLDSDIEQISHSMDNSDSLRLQLPPDTDVPIVNCSPGSTRPLLACGEEPGYERHCSPQQTNTPMQQLCVTEPVQVEQSDQLVSLSNLLTFPPPDTTLERTCSDVFSSSNLTQCSTRPTDTSMQQPVVAAVTQVEQSDPLFIQSDVPLLPLSVSTPARTGSEEFLITSHQIPCSAQQGEVLQQPTSATAVQVVQFNQLVDQSAVHPFPLSFMSSAERTPSEAIRNINTQHESGNHVLPFFPMSNWLPPQGLHPDPLQNELTKIQRIQDLCNKTHEDKKLHLRLECDQEIEKVRKKYDALLQDAETEFLYGKKNLDTIYNKVLMNRALAEQFRAKFIENRGASSHGQGSRSSSVQTQVVQRPASISSAPLPTPINIPSISAPASTPAPAPTPASVLASARLHSPASTVSSIQFSQVAHQTPSVFSSNLVRPHFSPILQPRGNLHLGSRTPAPHLHRYRPPTSLSIQNLPPQSSESTSQPRPHASLCSTPSITEQVSSFPTHSSISPIGSGVFSISHGNSVSPIEFPLDAGDFHHGADLPNHVPVKEFDGWLPSNLASAGNEVPPDAARSTSTTNVVYISDDEV